MKPHCNGLLLVLLAMLLAFGAAAQDDDGEDSVNGSQWEGNPELALPAFPDGLDWLNVERPLTVEDLRGKVVIFDFWTYGCINCIHMIPILKELEEKYADELVVIGVHSAKFSNEGETENIRQIVQRYEIEHPVINDSDFRVWRMYGVNAWPTFVIADPRGNVLAAQAGEIPFEPFDEIVSGMVAHFDSLGELDREPLDLTAPEGEGQPDSLLSFPGKVLADADSNRLFIADTNNNRIVIADLLTYEVLDVIGSGIVGYNGGDFSAATFNKPHGMALKDNLLYVADTNNHAIRVIDLSARTVDTLAGTGEIATGITAYGTVIREPRAFALRSPWDVEIGADNVMFIAMAGTHQIWEINLETNLLRVSVGNGREALYNETLATSELAQPSGLYFEDGLLYFADSESSSIRVADYTNDSVQTIAGPLENTLFDYGDEDGVVGTSRLQHALGIDGDDDGLIYIADTYNNKIKTIDQTTETITLYGMGENGGFADGGPEEAEFDEPGGLSYAEFIDGARLFVADTNNHAIRVIDLENETVSTIIFPNPEVLQIEDRVTVIGGRRDEALVLPEQSLAAGEGAIRVQLRLPEGYKLNDLAESMAEWNTEGEGVRITTPETTIESAEVEIPVTLAPGEGRLYGLLTIYFCEAINESLCFVDEFSVEVPVSVGDDAEAGTITIERELVPPQFNSPANTIGG